MRGSLLGLLLLGGGLGGGSSSRAEVLLGLQGVLALANMAGLLGVDPGSVRVLEPYGVDNVDNIDDSGHDEARNRLFTDGHGQKVQSGAQVHRICVVRNYGHEKRLVFAKRNNIWILEMGWQRTLNNGEGETSHALLHQNAEVVSTVGTSDTETDGRGNDKQHANAIQDPRDSLHNHGIKAEVRLRLLLDSKLVSTQGLREITAMQTTGNTKQKQGDFSEGHLQTEARKEENKHHSTQTNTTDHEKKSCRCSRREIAEVTQRDTADFFFCAGVVC